MNSNNNSTKIWLSLLLVGCLLFPLTVQFSHVFESHDHTSCSEITQHIHEKKFDCHVNDFHYNNFDTTASFVSLFIPTATVSSEVVEFSYLVASEEPQTLLLRGPPMHT